MNHASFFLGSKWLQSREDYTHVCQSAVRPCHEHALVFDIVLVAYGEQGIGPEFVLESDPSDLKESSSRISQQ